MGRPGALTPLCTWTATNHRLKIEHYLTEPVDARPLTSQARIEPVRIGRHEGRRVQPIDLQCQLDLAISDTSSISIEWTVRPDGPQTDPCPLAEQAAAIVEPKLP